MSGLFSSRAAAPRTRTLHAGPLALELSGPDVRNVSVGGVEVIQRIFVAVRDAAWATAPNRVTRTSVRQDRGRFFVELDVECGMGSVDVPWSARLQGTENGRVSIAFAGRARRDFSRNRIGFCVLHPGSERGKSLPMGVRRRNLR